MALIVIDASVAIAFRSPDDSHHAAAASALKEHRHATLVLPASAYAELLVQPTSMGTAAIARARRLVDGLPMRVEPITREIAERAALLRAKLRLPDALVVATGETLEADAILTADSRWKKASRRVRVI